MNENESICKNCGQRIVLVHFAFWDEWTHQTDKTTLPHRFCKSTVAEPTPSADDCIHLSVDPILLVCVRCNMSVREILERRARL